MRNLILVAFVEPVTDGLVFPRDDWPLHITLVRFDVEEESDDGVKSDDGGQASGLAERIAGLIDLPVRAALGTRLTIGDDAGFGRLGSVAVSLVEPSQPLQDLHESLMGTVAGLPGRVPTPDYTLDNYRPHVSHHGDKRTRPGDVVVLDRVALVDMAPDGNHSVRRILRLWELTK
ncbi:2'-5' RNA ligase family protein [Arthrobacter sp. NPDC093128]|uniref:2'-5' RNA ligase family protein n=1 Tax=Arthrobacter sp. NPDC093128 TaxID=3154979 RepID=UPI003415CDEE